MLQQIADAEGASMAELIRRWIRAEHRKFMRARAKENPDG
jgi:hypothetical protein